MGENVGSKVGDSEGDGEGSKVGDALGRTVGRTVGCTVGRAIGCKDGSATEVPSLLVMVSLSFCPYAQCEPIPHTRYITPLGVFGTVIEKFVTEDALVTDAVPGDTTSARVREHAVKSDSDGS